MRDREIHRETIFKDNTNVVTNISLDNLEGCISIKTASFN